ncbi:MAG: efflux RND transporter periplasmic adaptor subunit [Phycisphaeraceae bacterium]|nr:efflux RND transporter periplasmic adaptor subunit [Phycisphaeraceae bacterium]
MSTDKQHTPVPRSIPVKWLALLIVIFLIALTLGVYFAKPISSTIAKITPSANQADDGNDQSSSIQYYTCGMHPWIILPKPGSCPICSMTLVPLDPAKFTGEIAIDPVVVQNMGVRTGQVTTGPLVKTIRTVGTVDYNETLVRDINIKISGWIEKLYIDYLGAKVNEGDTLLDLYSPELYSAQEEYLIALRSSSSNNTLLESARTRLQYFDITNEQIATLEKNNKPSKTLAIQSPYTGVVIAKKANEGMKVNQGMQVFRIADLSKVWISVTLYEYQLPYIQLGNKATMSLPYIPGHNFEGTVVYIYPYLDKKTRDVQVRLEFDNPDGILKPGMFANVTLANRLANERTLVPREAIIDTGERKIAFVALGKGRFEPRDVITGIQTQNDQIEILRGLKPGETVVTSGQFLLDSEAKMRAALARMIQGPSAINVKSATKMTAAGFMPALPDPFANALNQVIKTYLAIGNQLAADSIDRVPQHAAALSEAIRTLGKQSLPTNEHFWHEHTQIKDALLAAQTLTKASDLKAARQQYALISIPLQQILKATGVPASLGENLDVLHCPMFRNSQGGSHWLQASGDVTNPYFGVSMLDCFDQQSTLSVAGKTTQPAQTQPIMQPATPAQAMNQLIKSYLAIQHQLTLENMDGISEQLALLRQSAKQLAAHLPNEPVNALIKSTNISVTDIKVFRDGFAVLSDIMIQLIKQTREDIIPSQNLYQAYCPMVKKNWIQSEKEIRNPYMTTMLDCGSIKAQLVKSPLNKTSTNPSNNVSGKTSGGAQ